MSPPSLPQIKYPFFQHAIKDLTCAVMTGIIVLSTHLKENVLYIFWRCFDSRTLTRMISWWLNTAGICVKQPRVLVHIPAVDNFWAKIQGLPFLKYKKAQQMKMIHPVQQIFLAVRLGKPLRQCSDHHWKPY